MRAALTTAALLFAVAAPARATILDPNFTESVFVNLGPDAQVTGMAWAPDGSNRLFVTRKGTGPTGSTTGAAEVRVVKNGVLLPTPFAVIDPVQVNAECGLLGIAFDPDFVHTQYVYFFITASASEQQIIRYTANGDVGTARTLIVGGLPTRGANHNGGALEVGPDGRLYFGIGDNANFTGTYLQPPLDSSDLVTLAAKVSRVNRDGTAPTDNPFFDGAGPNADLVFARGFRNPYTMTFQPSTGLLWVNSVGTEYEQVFVVRRGDHAGYRVYENDQVPPFLPPVIAYKTRNGGVDTYTIAANGAVRASGVATFTTTGTHRLREGEKVFITGVTDASFNAPGGVYVASTPTRSSFTVAQAGPDATSGGGQLTTLRQGNNAGTGAAITGGAFYDGTAWPAEYRGNFFYGDITSGRIMRATVGNGNRITSVDYWATNVTTAIDIAGGPDGNLYYAGYGGTIYRASYTAPPAGIVLSAANVRLMEGGGVGLAVRLASAPAADVTVTVSRSAGDPDVSVASGATLVFTPANWATPQPVILAAAEDADATDDVATLTASAPGLPPASATVRVTDDDADGLVLSTATLGMTEGTAGSFTVALARAPAADVVVTVARTAGDSDVSVTGGATLTFTPANWATPQTVTVAAAEDADNVDDAATLTASSPGLGARTVAVTVFDNDNAAPRIVTTPSLRGVIGALYTYDANATGTPAPTFSLGGTPPAGMTIDAATGVVSWTPSTAGSFPITVRATNGVLPDATQSFTVEVAADQPPRCVITEPSDGAILSGVTEFFGNGFDDVETTRAEFFVDGALAYTDRTPGGHYHYGGAHLLFDTRPLTDGLHTLRMVCYDTAGQSGAAEVTVVVSNGAPADLDGGAPGDEMPDGGAPTEAPPDDFIPERGCGGCATTASRPSNTLGGLALVLLGALAVALGRRRRRGTLFTIALLALAASACGGASAVDGETSAVIGPSGGVVASPSGDARLEIPAGALAADTRISLRRSTDHAGSFASDVWELGPDGLFLPEPARFSVRLRPDERRDDSQLRMVRLHGDLLELDGEPTLDAASQTLSAPLSGFSAHGATLLACPGGCPTTPTATASAVHGPPARIRLDIDCRPSGAAAELLIVERANVPALTSALAEFQNWTEIQVMPAPRPNAVGNCTATFDDYAVCGGWTYAYRVRAAQGGVRSDASRVSLAIGPGTRVCGGTTSTPNDLTVRTFRRDGAAPAVAADAPFVAVQDGSGAFVPIAPGALGVYTRPITDGAGRYGVAVACGASVVSLLQATLVEGATVDVTCASAAAGTTRSIQVRKTSCQRADLAVPSTVWSGPCDPALTQTATVPDVAVDAAGVAFTNSVPDRVYLEHGLAGVVTADFTGPRSAPVDLRHVTVGAGVFWTAALFTPTLMFTTSHGTGPGDALGFPANLRQATDLHRVCAGPFCHYLRALTDVDDSAQPPPVAPTATVTAADLTLAAPLSGLGAQLQLGGWTIALSRGWLGSALAYRTPRLCELPGSPARCFDATPRPATWTLTGFTPVGAWSLVDVWNATQRPHAAPDGLGYGSAAITGSL